MRPTVVPRFFKAHGLGNDYLVFDEGPGLVLDPDAIRRICRRRRGVGADGIVVVGESPADATPGQPIPLRMFNPDGGEFERSGNGLRIAGVYLRLRAERRGERPTAYRTPKQREGQAPGQAPASAHALAVSVGGDVVLLDVAGPDASGAVFDVRAEMGGVRFARGEPLRLRVGGAVLDAVRVSVGNPHAVIFGQGWTDDDVDLLGPLVAVHPAFPDGTNVQFASHPEGGEIVVGVWERGVGRTASSGTSACAAAAAAVRIGLAPPGAARVVMEGGAMEVDVADDWTVRLRGPVEIVCFGELASGANPGL